jgi:putative FmdB family regulatory protein
MPIYEYVCRECGHELEKLQKLSDPPLTECSACGESALKRKVSAAGFRLAGGGWYETDFKSEGKRNLAGDQTTNGSGKKKDGGEAPSSGSKEGKSDKSDKSNKSSKSDKSGKKAKTESATGSSATA